MPRQPPPATMPKLRRVQGLIQHVTCEKRLAAHQIVDTRNACDGDLLVRESLVTRRSGAMHVETSRSHQVLKDGTERVYQRHLLRRSYRDGGKVRKETLANLSHLPDEAIEAVRLVLAGAAVVDADATV